MSDSERYAVVASELAFEGEIFDVRRNRVRMPAGNVATREFVETVGAVAIVALDEERRVCLIRHYRNAIGAYVWELPAGRMDVAGEGALDTAKRELQEEVQLQSDAWSLLTTLITSPGFANERIHLFLAQHVQQAAKANDKEPGNEEADLVVEMRPLHLAVADIEAGAIQDAKSIAGILLAANRLATSRDP